MDTGGYRAVSFSYGKSNESIEENNNDADFGFRPPFQVPESLLQSLVSICFVYSVHLFAFSNIIWIESLFFFFFILTTVAK